MLDRNVENSSSLSKRNGNSILIVIITVNSRFLERTQKQSRGNQLIHRCLTRTKSIDNGQDPESQAVRQLWWMVFGLETGREVCGRRWIRIGFVGEPTYCIVSVDLFRVSYVQCNIFLCLNQIIISSRSWTSVHANRFLWIQKSCVFYNYAFVMTVKVFRLD